MRIREARIFSVHIPFTLEITHGMASRSACDSFIIRLSTDAGTGYGEVLTRDYVSGSLGGPGAEQNRLVLAAASARRMIAPLADRDVSWPGVCSFLETLKVDLNELPILCGVEGALLDCACRAEGTDIYGLLGMPPACAEVIYGGTLPMLPPEARKRFIALVARLRLPNLRVKLGKDHAYADETLAMVRETFGSDYDLRVDVNASWSWQDAVGMLPLLRKHGVSLIEEPFGRDRKENLRFAQDPATEGFELAADESALTPEDVRVMASQGTFQLVNIRLAKCGGLLRALQMRAAALSGGLRIHAGCHVGETGILSALGRAAAALMPEAAYVDGSYDGYILAGNITTESFTFGEGGKGRVITGKRCGYDVDEGKLERYADGQLPCL